jgi:hypothetical protein
MKEESNLRATFEKCASLASSNHDELLCQVLKVFISADLLPSLFASCSSGSIINLHPKQDLTFPMLQQSLAPLMHQQN